MPVQMIGDILAAELSHMQAYIRFCSCQLNGAALLQQKTDEDTDFKEFLKVTPFWNHEQASPVPSWRQRCAAAQSGLHMGKGIPPVSKGNTNTAENFLSACVTFRVELVFLGTGAIILPIY